YSCSAWDCPCGDRADFPQRTGTSAGAGRRLYYSHRQWDGGTLPRTVGEGMFSSGRTYDEVRRAFSWIYPGRYNTGVDTVEKNVAAGHGNKPALVYEHEDGTVERHTFRDIARESNRFANLLFAQGLKPGDRIGILLPQRPETA